MLFHRPAALAFALVFCAAGAHADPRVQWHISIGVPIPAPVVVAPYPVVRAPVPVYYRDDDAYDHHRHRRGHYRDDDRDGIPNRYDRHYTPRWDVDGDGVPNRHDRRPYDPRR